MRAGFQRLINGIGGGLFLALFVVFLVQIAARFGLSRPLPWTDELAVVLYVWVILWAAAFMVPAREHVVFDLVWNSVGPRARQAMAIAAHLLLGGLAPAGLPATWDYVSFMRRESTPVLGIPFLWVFLPLVLLVAALAVRSAWGLWQALRGQGLEAEVRTQ